jgi:hypothetical protein
MRILTGCALFLALMATSGCHVSFNGLGAGVQGSGVKVTDIRGVPEFTKVRVTNSANVIVQIGDEQTVEVEVDDNLVDLITTDVSSGEMTVSSDGSYSTSIGVTVRVTVPRLEAASISGSGDITVSGLAADTFEATIRGSGDITVVGTARRVEATVTGSGDIDLSQLNADTGAARVTGSGDISISVSEELKARVTGSGDIRYRGHSGSDPKVDESVTGSGDISKQ